MNKKFLIIPILLTITITGCYSARGPAYESRAKGTLRSIGASQLAYQGTNDDHSFGTFQELQRSLYIAGGYGLNTMIEGYTLEWNAYASEPIQDVDDGGIEFADRIDVESTEHEPYDRFTIIARPRDKKYHTYGITEDQVVRVYNPDNENDPDDVATWDPIV